MSSRGKNRVDTVRQARPDIANEAIPAIGFGGVDIAWWSSAGGIHPVPTL